MNKISLDAGRANLPTEAVRPFGDPTSGEDIPVWLWLVDVGHLRVIAYDALQAILGADITQVDAMTLRTREERERLAALRMRLFRTSIKPTRRLMIPAEVFDACEEEDDRKHVWINFLGGALDIYTSTYRNKRLATPSNKLLARTENAE